MKTYFSIVNFNTLFNFISNIFFIWLFIHCVLPVSRAGGGDKEGQRRGDQDTIRSRSRRPSSSHQDGHQHHWRLYGSERLLVWLSKSLILTDLLLGSVCLYSSACWSALQSFYTDWSATLLCRTLLLIDLLRRPVNILYWDVLVYSIFQY